MKEFTNLIDKSALIAKGFRVEPKEEEKPDLIKSHITEAFASHAKGPKLTKKGSDIKDKVKEVRKKEEEEVQAEQSKYTAILTQLGENAIPNEEPDEWLFKGTKHKHTIIPKVFGYEQMYEKAVTMDSNPSLVGGHYSKSSYKTSEEDRILCDKYNQAVRKFIQHNTEIHLLDTLSESLSDDQEYEFSLEQLASLGY